MVDLDTLSIVLTGIGLIIAITYYTLTLRAATKTRQSQLFMNIYNQTFCNPEFLNAVKIIHHKKTGINSAEDFFNAYDYLNPTPEDPEFQDAWNYVSSFYEGLGVFLREGLIDIRLISLSMNAMTQYTWDVIAPYLEEIREYYGVKRFSSEWEYLMIELNRYIEKNPEFDSYEREKDTVFSLRYT